MAKLEMPITIDTQAVVNCLMQEISKDRLCRMVLMYGEACTKTEAAKIISCSTQTITAMLEDGRILPACEGTKINTQSLAEYIDRKSEMDRSARMHKHGRKVLV